MVISFEAFGDYIGLGSVIETIESAKVELLNMALKKTLLTILYNTVHCDVYKVKWKL
jgi:hypothetical protein